MTQDKSPAEPFRARLPIMFRLPSLLLSATTFFGAAALLCSLHVIIQHVAQNMEVKWLQVPVSGVHGILAALAASLALVRRAPQGPRIQWTTCVGQSFVMAGCSLLFDFVCVPFIWRTIESFRVFPLPNANFVFVATWISLPLCAREAKRPATRDLG